MDILKVHCRGKPLAEALDLQIVAKRTTGFSGASLANLMNEAAIIAARNGKQEISYDEPDYDLVTKVTIIPRTNGAGGFTLFTPPEERMESGMYSKKYLKGNLAVALGGRVAEELVFGPEQVTTGASNDLQQVRNIARRMVTQWGYSKNKLGAVAWES